MTIVLFILMAIAIVVLTGMVDFVNRRANRLETAIQGLNADWDLIDRDITSALDAIDFINPNALEATRRPVRSIANPDGPAAA